MRAIIGSTLLSSKVAQPAKKPFEIYDSRLPGFTLRVQASGVRSGAASTSCALSRAYKRWREPLDSLIESGRTAAFCA